MLTCDSHFKEYVKLKDDPNFRVLVFQSLFLTEHEQSKHFV